MTNRILLEDCMVRQTEIDKAVTDKLMNGLNALQAKYVGNNPDRKMVEQFVNGAAFNGAFKNSLNDSNFIAAHMKMIEGKVKGDAKAIRDWDAFLTNAIGGVHPTAAQYKDLKNEFSKVAEALIRHHNMMIQRQAIGDKVAARGVQETKIEKRKAIVFAKPPVDLEAAHKTKPLPTVPPPKGSTVIHGKSLKADQGKEKQKQLAKQAAEASKFVSGTKPTTKKK